MLRGLVRNFSRVSEGARTGRVGLVSEGNEAVRCKWDEYMGFSPSLLVHELRYRPCFLEDDSPTTVVEDATSGDSGYCDDGQEGGDR